MAKSITKERQKLGLSHLDSQRELLTKDVDLTQLSFITRNLPPLRFDELVTSGQVNRTIEGASTITITLDDSEGIIRNSGRLARTVDIKLDGLWFRLVKVQKSGFSMTLTFESREVAILRTYNGKRVVGWGKMRRSRFMQILVEEVKEFKIPFLCPDLLVPKKVRDKKDRTYKREPGMGFQTEPSQSPDTREAARLSLTIKRAPADRVQLANVEQALDVGHALGANRKVLVAGAAAGIVESRFYNINYGDRDSVGILQQRPSQGWTGLTNIAKAFEEFFTRAIRYDKQHPNITSAQIAQAVQGSAYPERYAQYQDEAERLVTSYGVVGDSDGSLNDANLMFLPDAVDDSAKYQFTRGRPTLNNGGAKGWDKEDSWTCLQRLANEVNWRCFEVSGTIYLTTDKHLFKSAPRARLSEQSEGVDWIDFDYDIGKPTSQVTIQAYIDRWQAPPGTIIELFDMGPVNGRWLITNIQRGIFDQLGTITLKKPEARLPEPKKTDATSLLAAFTKQTDTYVPTPGYDPQPPNTLPKGRALREAVLNNPQITFSRKSQQYDITTGSIDERVLQFLLNFTEAGFSALITALRSDHRPGTNHEAGRAVDISGYTDKTTARTFAAMTWVNAHKAEFGPKLEFIGPIDSLVLPLGVYDSDTLNDHNNHLHVGWDA